MQVTARGVQAMPGVEHCDRPAARVQATQPSVQAAQAPSRPNPWTETVAAPGAVAPSRAMPGGPNAMKQRSDRQGIIPFA